MPHYDKLRPQPEAAVDDRPAEARAAPSLESALLRAHENVTRRTLWIGSAKATVLHALIDNVRPGTRIAIVKQPELARQCGISRTYLQQLLRDLHLDPPHFIKREKRQRASRYRVSDELFDAVQPEPTILGELLNGPPVPIRPAGDAEPVVTVPDARSGVHLNPDAHFSMHQNSNSDAHTGVHLNPDAHPGVHQDSLMLTPACITNPGHKEIARATLASKLDSKKENGLSTYLAGKALSIELLPEAERAGIEAVWAKLRSYDPKVDRKGAQKLVRDFRQNERGEVTFPEICHCIGELGDYEKHNTRIDSLGGFLIAEVPRRYPGSLLAEYRKQQDRQLRLDLNQETESRQREDEAKDDECQTEGATEMSPAAVTHQERERQARANGLADWLRRQAQWLARQDPTKGSAERVEQIAQQVERFELLAVVDLLAGIQREIDEALLAATAANDLDLVRSRVVNRKTQLSEELLAFWNVRLLKVPEKLLRAWREVPKTKA